LKAFTVNSIGTVQRDDTGCTLHYRRPVPPGSEGAGHFSHIIVLWWATEQDTPEARRQTTCRPPYAPDKLTGLFATRAEYRPNPIGMTVCPLDEVDEENGVVQVRNIDTFDGTPILDIKAYFPVCDRVNGATIPAWLDWGIDHLPEEGMGLFEEYEEEVAA
jgi:tRNA-Thr(GGU) m(6)t(6)A37 methyltransferase TsaA